MGTERVADSGVLAIADTGPLIVLAELDAVDLLETIDTLYVPETVLDELEDSQIRSELEALDFERVSAPDSSQFEALDPGERAALLVASEYDDAIVLTDDMAARRTATEQEIEVHGSVGVIVLAYSRDEITYEEAVELLRSLQSETSLFVTETIIERGIELLAKHRDE
jgi:predicted nucleic acid-binding protein